MRNLQSMGLSADGVVGGGLLTTSHAASASSVRGMTLLGVRRPARRPGVRRQRSRACCHGRIALSPDIAQRTYSISAAQQLTTSSLSLTANRSNNQGQGVSQFASLDSYMAGWSIQLGRAPTLSSDCVIVAPRVCSAYSKLGHSQHDPAVLSHHVPRSLFTV